MLKQKSTFLVISQTSGNLPPEFSQKLSHAWGPVTQPQWAGKYTKSPGLHIWWSYAQQQTLLAATSRYNVATGQTAMTSHVRGLPPAHGTSVIAISSGYSTWFLSNWNAGRDKRASYQIIQGVVSRRAPRCLLADETVNPTGINQ